MKFHILAIDKIRSKPIAQLCNQFQKRISHPHTLTIKELKRASNPNLSPEQIKQEEGQSILNEVSAAHSSSTIFALDERGISLTSTEFAHRLQDITHHHSPNLTFIIGGAYGLSPEVKQRAHTVLRLSHMTLLHEFARLILIEQLYRATTILQNHPYHK